MILVLCDADDDEGTFDVADLTVLVHPMMVVQVLVLLTSSLFSCSEQVP